MNKINSVTQIGENIFKVVRGGSNFESLVVKRPFSEFGGENDCRYEIKNDLITFYKGNKAVIEERAGVHTAGFVIDPKTAVYGGGIHQGKPLNRRNTTLRMVGENGVSTSVPFFTSTGGWALFIDNYSFMSIGFDRLYNYDTTEDVESKKIFPNTVNIYADDSETFVYYIILENEISKQIDAFRQLTGKAPLYPKWAYGFFQCRERYKTEEQILAVAKEIRKRHIPCDCIVQDWNYWREGHWNELKWDEARYPTPQNMVKSLHNDFNLKLMVSVWPTFGPDNAVTKEFEQAGAIIEKPDKSGEKWGRVHDAYNPKAKEIMWRHMNEEFFKIGVDAWWLDASEPSLNTDSTLTLKECNACYKGEMKKYLNTFALQETNNIYTSQRKTDENKRVYILTRSGFAGQQANAATSWTGDIWASWRVFKEQVSALISFSVSGVPYSTTDIGAFVVKYDGGNKNEEYKELYTRWFWFGAFSPIFRSHGTNTEREMWYFGEEGTPYYDSQLRASRLHYRLLPYIYSNAFKVYNDNGSMIHALAEAFQEDENCKNIDTAYMYGDSLLVEIITDYGVKEKWVYLPKGACWHNIFTGEKLEGGTHALVNAEIDKTPIFAKGGSIIITGNNAENVSECSKEEFGINIFSGSDAKEILYIDAEDNYNYEKGEYAIINFEWNNEAKILTISKPLGECKKFQMPKRFNISLDFEEKLTVEYENKSIGISLMEEK